MARNIFNGKPIIDPSTYGIFSSVLPESMFTIGQETKTPKR